MMNESMFDQMEENNWHSYTYYTFQESVDDFDSELTKYNLFEDTEKGSQNLCEDWMQNVKLNNLGECLSVCSNDDQPVPENDVELETLSITNERTGSTFRKRRHKLNENEKQTRRKESNRKAAEKYRNKKKKEQRNSAEKFKLMSDMVEKLVTITKVHLSRCKDKDEGLLGVLKKAEHLLKDLN